MITQLFLSTREQLNKGMILYKFEGVTPGEF